MPSGRAHDSIGFVIPPTTTFSWIPSCFLQHTTQCKYNRCSSDSNRKILTRHTSAEILMLAPRWWLHQFQRSPSHPGLLERKKFIKLWEHLLFICVSTTNSQQPETVSLVLIIFWGCREREVFQKCVFCWRLFQGRQKARGNENILHCILQWF